MAIPALLLASSPLASSLPASCASCLASVLLSGCPSLAPPPPPARSSLSEFAVCACRANHAAIPASLIACLDAPDCQGQGVDAAALLADYDAFCLFAGGGGSFSDETVCDEDVKNFRGKLGDLVKWYYSGRGDEVVGQNPPTTAIIIPGDNTGHDVNEAGADEEGEERLGTLAARGGDEEEDEEVTTTYTTTTVTTMTRTFVSGSGIIGGESGGDAAVLAPTSTGAVVGADGAGSGRAGDTTINTVILPTNVAGGVEVETGGGDALSMPTTDPVMTNNEEKGIDGYSDAAAAPTSVVPVAAGGANGTPFGSNSSSGPGSAFGSGSVSNYTSGASDSPNASIVLISPQAGQAYEQAGAQRTSSSSVSTMGLGLVLMLVFGMMA